MNRKSILIFLIILSGLIPILPMPAYAEPTAYRGPDYIDTNLGIFDGMETHSWESAPLWIWDGSEYVPYIFGETDSYYQVQSGLIGARIYKSGYAEFWNPDVTEVRLYEEMWEVQYYDKGKWEVCDTYSPIFEVSRNENGINITVTFVTDWPNAGERSFVVKYIFRVGRALKHEIVFTSHSAETYPFRVLQKWAGIVADKVNENVITSAEVVPGYGFVFESNDDFSIYENQWAAMEYLDPVEIDVHAQGLKADFIFSNWTLSVGESLEIDPATITLSNPTVDGYTDSNGFNKRDNLDYIQFGKFFTTGPRYYRGYVEWPVAGIPNDATITTVYLRYHGERDNVAEDASIKEMTGCRPSITNYADLVAWIDAASSYVTPWNPVVAPNQVQDLGADAVIDLQASLGVDWFAIGFYGQMLDNNLPDSIYSEEKAGVTPPPTLYVVYQIVPTITSASITDMDDGDNAYEMRKYYTFQAVVDDANGADTISNVSLRIMNEAVRLAEVNATTLDGVPAFAITFGDGVIDLDVGSCSWGEAGDVGTATFKIRFEWDFVDIADLELSVYVMDEDGNSAGWTEIASDYFDVIGRLVTSGLVANSTYVPVGDGIQITGTVYYAATVGGDVASAFFPLDAQFTGVVVHNATHDVEGTDASIVNGEFSVDFTIPGVVGTYTYHIYLDLLPDYVDADAPDGDTVTVYGMSAALLLPFDDETGLIAYDWGGSSNDGTIYGATRTDYGLYGRALEFDGVDDYVLVNVSAFLNITSEIFISAWIYTGDPGVQGIVNKNGSYGLSVLSNYAVRLTINTTNLDTAPNVFEPLTWAFVAGWYDGSQMSIIIDGVNTSSQATSGPISLNNTDVYIGNDPNYFNGTIDEVRILGSAPSLLEINGLMWDPIATFPYCLQATITTLESGNWVFAESEYTFTGTYVRQNASYTFDSFGLRFSDGVNWANATFDSIEDDFDVNEDIVFLVSESDSSSGNVWTINWELYILDTPADIVDVDIEMFCNVTSGESDGYEVVMDGYFSIFSLGMTVTYDFNGDGANVASGNLSTTGGGIWGIGATNSSLNSWAMVNKTVRNLRHSRFYVHLFTNNTYDVGNNHWNCFSECTETGYWAFGWFHYYDLVWVEGPRVEIRVQDGMVGPRGMAVGSGWVLLNVTTYNGGSWVQMDYIYAYPEAYLSTDDTTQIGIIVDLWVSDVNSSSVLGVRVTAENYAMNKSGWGPFTTWTPRLNEIHMCEVTMPFLSDTFAIISAPVVEMYKVFVIVNKTAAGAGNPTCDNHQFTIADKIDVNFVTTPVTETHYGVQDPMPVQIGIPGVISPGWFTIAADAIVEGIMVPILRGLRGAAEVPYFIAKAGIDAVGEIMGVADFIDTTVAYTSNVGAHFGDSVTNFGSMITSMWMVVTLFFGTFISWSATMLTFLTTLFTIMGGIIDGTGDVTTGLGDLWSVMNFSVWVGFVPVILFVYWLDSIDERAKRMGGGHFSLMYGDIQMWVSVFSMFWNWFATIISIVINGVMGLAGFVRPR